MIPRNVEAALWDKPAVPVHLEHVLEVGCEPTLPRKTVGVRVRTVSTTGLTQQNL